MSRPIGFLRTTLLLLRLHWRATVRFYPEIWRIAVKKGLRTGTARKSSGGLAWAALLALVLFALLFLASRRTIVSVDEAVGRELPSRARSAASRTTPGVATGTTLLSIRQARSRGKPRPLSDPAGPSRPVRLPDRPGLALPGETLKGLTVVLTALLGCVFLNGMLGVVFRVEDPEEEWLSTLPIQPSHVLANRIIRRAMPRPADAMLLAFCLAMALDTGMGWVSPFMAVPISFLLMMGQGGLEMPLRWALRRVRQDVRNGFVGWCAALLLLTCLGLWLAMSMGASNPCGPVPMAIRRLPEWVLLTPPGLAVTALATPEFRARLPAVFLLAVQAIVLGLAGTCAVKTVAGQGLALDGGGHGPRLTRASRGLPVLRGVVKWVLSPTARLAFAATTAPGAVQQILGMVVALVVAMLTLGYASAGDELMTTIRQEISRLASSPHTVAALAFLLPTWLISSRAPYLLPALGPGIWLIYSVPRRMEELLRHLAATLGALAALCCAALLIIAVHLGTPVTVDFLLLSLKAVVGSFSMPFIAVCLSIVNSDPAAEDAARRHNPSATTISALLLTLYGGTLLPRVPMWQTVTTIVFIAAVFVAIWQKAVDAIPYVLDPVARPPERVTLADGLIGMQIFIALQIFLGVLFSEANPESVDSACVVLLSFCGAGFMTWAWLRFAIWRHGLAGRPRILGGDWRAGLRHGVLLGLQAATAGGIWVGLVASSVSGSSMLMAQMELPLVARVLLLLLATVAAPLFEEFLFRGLVFGGLRRSWSLWPAVLGSAVIFAMCHPLVAVPPVFCAGVLFALAYERTGRLLAPMVAHALYNLVVLGPQLYR